MGELSEVSATSILVQCGGLNIGRREDPSMRQVAESARVHGLKLLPLGRAEMADRYPQHVLAEDDMAYFDPGRDSSGASRRWSRRRTGRSRWARGSSATTGWSASSRGATAS